MRHMEIENRKNCIDSKEMRDAMFYPNFPFTFLKNEHNSGIIAISNEFMSIIFLIHR